MAESLYGLLQNTAQDHGWRAAVSFRGSQVSYAELLDRADRLAALLAAHGAGPGCHLAFSFVKSVDALAALFAAIRTGATYVPLDPAWPVERQAMICEDAGIEIWLGSKPPGFSGIRVAFVSSPGECGAKVVALSDARTSAAATSDPREASHDISNVLYTSGSTGRPKGVQITTRSLSHFSHWVVKSFDLSPEDRVANHAPYQFDLSTLDIFAAVRAGATMCPVPEGTKMIPYQMTRFIGEERITIWYSVPSALQMIQSHLSKHDLSSLRHVFFAGEVMPKPAIKALACALPQAALTNLYGPTETNVCTFHRVGPDDLACDDPLPIGLPIDDTRVWIVDEGYRPLEGCATGELLVAGPTVTAGYLGDSRLTGERLVAAPDGEGRAYTTRDCVTRRPDGVLLFNGRTDRMFKCYGYRVEPGEIEAALCRHSLVKEAAVIPVPAPSVGGHLIKACVARRPEAPITEAELVSFCRDRLPAYMIPQMWQFWDELPRTDRGKVDLYALERS